MCGLKPLLVSPRESFCIDVGHIKTSNQASLRLVSGRGIFQVTLLASR